MNMIRPQKKSKSAGFTALLLTIIMVIGCFTTACQTTPENNVVIQKDNYENLIDITATPNDSIIPDSTVAADSSNGNSHIYWQDVFAKDFSNKKAGGGYDKHELTVTVDADIIVPKETASVYLIEPADFSADFAKNAVNYFLNGTFYDDMYTKDDWLIKILPIEQALVNMIDFENGSGDIESFLKIYKKHYTMASENNSQGTLEFEQGRFSHIAVKGYPYNGAVAELYIGNGGMQYTDFYYVVDDGQQIYKESKEEYSGVLANGMNKSYDEALQMANEAMDSLFEKEMVHIQTALVNKIFIDENYPITYKGYYDNYNQCYVFYFTPSYNGIPQLYAPEAQNSSDRNSGGEPMYSQSWDYEYSMKWPAEYTQVIMDDKGIVELWSYSPSAIVEQVNSNVQMLPFDDIFEIFKKNIFYSSAWDDGITLKIDIDIDKIVFGMIRTPVKDNPSQYYMVPAWQFIGSKSSVARGHDASFLAQLTEKRRSEIELQMTYKDYHESGKTFMVLNAIDGSIIDTSYFVDVQDELKKYIGYKKE